MFGELIAAYLFLGGTGGGACVVMGVLGLLADGADVRRGLSARFRDGRGRLYARFFGAALVAALVSLGLGVACLMADVGRPDRVALLLASPPSTYLTFGAWALLVCGLLALAALLVWRGVIPARPWALRVLHGLLAAAGFVTVLYTGLLLSSMVSVPLWNSPWLAAVFALSGVSCGVALVLLATIVANALEAFSLVARRLVRADTALLAAEAVAVALWIASVWLPAAHAGDAATATDVAALQSVGEMCAGRWAPWLWLGVGLAGLALPAVLEIIMARRPRVGLMRPCRGSASEALAAPSPGFLLAAALLVLVGGACLRYLVIFAGVMPAPIYPF